MRVQKIELKGFRVFKGHYEIDLGDKGQNLLVYGENGSGKTSLYQALNLFLSPRPPYPDYSSNENIFTSSDENYVKLLIGDENHPSEVYEWSEEADPFSLPLIISAAKTKGFFDYKSLLETYFLQQDSKRINLFDIFIRYLIPHKVNGITNRPFGEEWQTLLELSKKRKSKKTLEQIDSSLLDFNDGLTNLIQELNEMVNVILSEFDQSISIELSSSDITFDAAEKKYCDVAVDLEVKYYQKLIEDHHHFLNESRLSAIALSIYLVSILLNPPSLLKLLVLDDVLIGLDMSNRLPLIDIVQKEFIQKDWQVIITTYDRVWYEILCQRLPANKWTRAEFFCGKTSEYEFPIYKTGLNWLDKAEEFLNDGEYKASVIYIRTGFEHILKNYCDTKHLKVSYQIDNKYTSQVFWECVLAEGLLSKQTIHQIELYRSKILNPMSHASYVNPYADPQKLDHELR